MMNFLADLLKRLISPNSKFFSILQKIALVLSLITGLPAFLEAQGVVLPEAIATIASKVVSIASLVAAFIAQLTVSDTVKKTLNIK